MNPFTRFVCSSFLNVAMLSCLALLSACGSGSSSDDPEPLTPTPSVKPVIQSFAFLAQHNPTLQQDVFLDVSDGKVEGRLPAQAQIDQLVASIEFTGSSVFVQGQQQTSGVSVNDFSQSVEYQVQNEQSEQVSYQVDLVHFTGLPMVYIDTLGGIEITSKEDYVDGTLQIVGNRQFDDFSSVEIEIRGRGNSTWFVHPKKPYQMKLSNKASILDMPAKKKWLLLAEYSDKSFLRNTLAFELGYLSRLDWTPRSEFVEVFLNGQYNGTYNLSEKVEEGSNRVNIGDDGYLLEVDQLDRQGPDDVYFYTDQFLIAVKEPEIDTGGSEYQFIDNYINEFEDVLYSAHFNDPENGYPKYIDVDSFVDWFLISEIAKNVDSKFYSSIYFHVIPGEKIKMGPLWDFDLGFGNVDYADAQFANGFWVKDNPWISRLLVDPEFKSKVKQRFAFFRSQQSLLLEKIDGYALQLQWSQQENDQVWHTLGEYVWPNPVVYDSYEEEVQHLKTWLTRRMNWLETAISDM